MIPLSVYLHWPWCIQKCPYCDFNSHRLTAPSAEQHYLQSLLLQIERVKSRSGNRPISTVYLGGGTPSLLSAASIEKILSVLHNAFTLTENAEISMEANPGTFEYQKFKDFKSAGINRLSIGIQSFNDQKLKILGRVHNSEEAKRAAFSAGQIFDNFNLDLMFALPYQTMKELEEDIKTVLSFNSTHLSYYQLTIEPNTYFGKYVPDGLPDDDMRADMSDFVVESLKNGGFEQYEVSGYSKKGFQCRHNLNYWEYGDYFGLGPGAHGKITEGTSIRRTVSAVNPQHWQELINNGKDGFVKNSVVPTEDIPFEFMLNTLRLKNGVQSKLWEERTFLPLSTIDSILERLRSQGLLSTDTSKFQCTEKGWNFLNYIQEEFLCTTS